MTAALGVNDDEIGAVVKRGLDTPYVGGVTIQPVFGSGRSHGDRPARPADPHRRARPARGADRRAGDLARPHRPAVLAPALLLRRLPAARRRRDVALAHRARRPRAAQGVPRAAAGCRGEPDRRRRAARPGCASVVKDSLLGLLSEQSSLSHPDVGQLWKDVCENCDLGIGTLRTLAASALPGQRAAAPAARRTGAAGDGQALHGHVDDDRGATHAVLRPRGHGQRAERRRTSALRSAPCRPGPPWPARGSRRPPAAGPEVRPVTLPEATPRGAAASRTTPCGCASSRRSPCSRGWPARSPCVVFAGLGFVGLLRARRAGLTRSKCLLRDTRLVLAYLGVLLVAGAVGTVLQVQGWLDVL